LRLVVLSFAGPVAVQGTDHGRAYTFSGEDLGAINLHDIMEDESSVRFASAGNVSRRQLTVLRDRRVELVTLRNGASMVVTTVLDRRVNFGPASYDPARGALNFLGRIKVLTDLGFVFDETAVKRAGRVAYEVQLSASVTCFVYDAFLGDGVNLVQQIHRAAWYAKDVRTAAELEREMLSLLALARFARASNPSDFSVTLEIPAARLVSASAQALAWSVIPN